MYNLIPLDFIFLLLILLVPTWSVYYIFKLRQRHNISFFIYYSTIFFVCLLIYIVYKINGIIQTFPDYKEFGYGRGDIINNSISILLSVIFLALINFKVKVRTVLRNKALLKFIILPLILFVLIIVLLNLIALLMLFSSL